MGLLEAADVVHQAIVAFGDIYPREREGRERLLTWLTARNFFEPLEKRFFEIGSHNFERLYEAMNDYAVRNSPKGIPSVVPIRREQGYHTDLLGKYGDEQQFMGFSLFLESGQKRPASVLHLFDAAGNHIDSEIWESPKIADLADRLEQKISTLPNCRRGNIRIKPFKVDLNGVKFGLVPREDGHSLEYVPYGLVFVPPWDGTYDT